MGDLRKLAAMVAVRDPAAAPELRIMAARLNAMAEDLERPKGFTDNGGFADRCRLQVIGPDGTLKQETDTGA